MDFAGHLHVKGTTLSKYCSVALFTCAKISAKPLDIWSDITMDTLLLAFQGSLGIPHTIYTNNEQTFHSANRKFVEL